MQKKNSYKYLNLYAIAIALYGYLIINIGLPAYPSLKNYFGTSEEFVKFSITVLLFGFGFSQIVWGALSEKYGRKKIIITAVSISVLGSLLTSFSETIAFFTVSRFLEGFGAGFAAVFSRAILADTFKNKKLPKTISNTIAVIALGPAFSPIIGGEILALTSWQTVYIFLTIIGGILLYSSIFQLKETHEKPNKTLNLKKLFIIISKIFSHKKFMGYFLPYSIILSGLITFYAISPYIFIKQFKFSASNYSYLLIAIGVANTFGTLYSKKLIDFLDSDAILKLGFLIALMSGATTFIFYLFDIYNFYIVLGAMMFYGISCGFISPICNAEAINALSNDDKTNSHRGITSSILGGGIMVISSILTYGIAKVQFDSILKICILISSLVIFAFGIFLFLIEKEKGTLRNAFNFLFIFLTKKKN
ncbi:multidrug effflux MFS transporter [Aureivirga marina]|uniref:multidrug effflux MFS transporter n=1 Tax=Aureivirga marina TaxID=1182451 RepID=UPI0018CADC74|nr:multidrug effflux MFS transporter [Aureivirga marina]